MVLRFLLSRFYVGGLKVGVSGEMCSIVVSLNMFVSFFLIIETYIILGGLNVTVLYYIGIN